jgi:hypothetical protein
VPRPTPHDRLRGKLGERAAHGHEAYTGLQSKFRFGGQLVARLKPVLVDVLQNERYRLFV